MCADDAADAAAARTARRREAGPVFIAQRKQSSLTDMTIVFTLTNSFFFSFITKNFLKNSSKVAGSINALVAFRAPPLSGKTKIIHIYLLSFQNTFICFRDQVCFVVCLQMASKGRTWRLGFLLTATLLLLALVASSADGKSRDLSVARDKN